MIKGQCLCGEVRFEIDPDGIVLFNNCYCKKCQRNSGAGFVSQIQVLRDKFRWLNGEGNLQFYESSPGVKRGFCGSCGSRSPMTEVPGAFIPVPVGLLDDGLDRMPEVNMHLRSKAPWALVDEDIDCLEDQGSSEFWESFMKRQQHDA